MNLELLSDIERRFFRFVLLGVGDPGQLLVATFKVCVEFLLDSRCMGLLRMVCVAGLFADDTSLHHDFPSLGPFKVDHRSSRFVEGEDFGSLGGVEVSGYGLKLGSV